jgi:hypothetical protein|tara:strand:- start:643 stop:918 length:276 start_codon:yes stop_codon:yes gene_type:complete
LQELFLLLSGGLEGIRNPPWWEVSRFLGLLWFSLCFLVGILILGLFLFLLLQFWVGGGSIFFQGAVFGLVELIRCNPILKTVNRTRMVIKR